MKLHIHDTHTIVWGLKSPNGRDVTKRAIIDVNYRAYSFGSSQGIAEESARSHFLMRNHVNLNTGPHE